MEREPITEFAAEETYDIVVVGAGCAGVPAVLTAVEEGAKAVSYTHLDVYKRQGVNDPAQHTCRDKQRQGTREAPRHHLSTHNAFFLFSKIAFITVQTKAAAMLRPGCLYACLLYTSRCV